MTMTTINPSAIAKQNARAAREKVKAYNNNPDPQFPGVLMEKTGKRFFFMRHGMLNPVYGNTPQECYENAMELISGWASVRTKTRAGN